MLSLPLNSSYAMFATSLLSALMGASLVVTDQTVLLHTLITMCNTTPIYFPVIFDPISCIFCASVTFIAANVLRFAETYMAGDPFLSRFTHLVLLFVYSMLMLIFFPHLITLLLGWDGLGLISFLLVIYYRHTNAASAGMITALTNRIGDAALLVGLGWSLEQGHWSPFHLCATESSAFIPTMILLAAMTKSAQVPFSCWLPAAMAAPTPVSALVHSSTLVTAGVYLLIRFDPFLSKFTWYQPTLLFVATLTMTAAGLAAIAECDMKKVVALSTLSQLGVMMASLGLGMPNLAFFHLITHAMFKALLFICVGTLIHTHNHSQDLRTMGNLVNQMPLTLASLNIANLSLCGAPFMSGFYSKDAILETSLSNPTNPVIMFMLFFATGLTAAYSIRLSITTLWSPQLSTPLSGTHDHDPFLTSAMLPLTVMAMMAGSVMNWTFIQPAAPMPLPYSLKLLTMLVTYLGADMALSMNQALTTNPTVFSKLPMIHHGLTTIMFLKPISSQNIIEAPLSNSISALKTIDHGWLETTSGQGIFSTLKASTTWPTTAQHNFLPRLLMLSMVVTGQLMLFQM